MVLNNIIDDWFILCSKNIHISCWGSCGGSSPDIVD